MKVPKIAILEEGKTPPDERVPFLPNQAKKLMEDFPCEVVVQQSKVRRVTDDAYQMAGLNLVEDVSDCDILFGVKEVPIDRLLPNKTYFFFSHTIKKQPYNRNLLRAVLAKNIRLIDYECLTNENGQRIIGFGRFAGIVGAYNGFRMIGEKTGSFYLKPAHQCENRSDLLTQLIAVKSEPLKICITGSGRVASGALEVMNELGIVRVSVEEYLQSEFDHHVFVQLDAMDYNQLAGEGSGSMQDFVRNPENYKGTFRRFLPKTDFYIACHFWANRSPVLFSAEDMKRDDFRLQYIADISCDINGPIPSTIRPSTIADPFYGIDKLSGEEVALNAENALAVMAVDNLPCELPLDASEDFGNQLLNQVAESLFDGDKHSILERATIAEEGKLTSRFTYLRDYVEGNE